MIIIGRDMGKFVLENLSNCRQSRYLCLIFICVGFEVGIHTKLLMVLCCVAGFYMCAKSWCVLSIFFKYIKLDRNATVIICIIERVSFENLWNNDPK